MLIFLSTKMKLDECNPWPLSIFNPLQGKWTNSSGNIEKKKLGIVAAATPLLRFRNRMHIDNKCGLAKLRNKGSALSEKDEWSSTFREGVCKSV